jgi:anti-sigma factor RsiW
MKCRYSENDIALYVEGDLPLSRVRELHAHVAACSECRELAADLRESQLVFKSLRQETVTAAALSSVRSRVLDEIGGAAIRPAWGRWVYALAGGLFLVMMFVGVMWEMKKVNTVPGPVLSQGGVAALSTEQPRSGSMEVEPITPPAPVKNASNHFVRGRSHPSLTREGSITLPPVFPDSSPAIPPDTAPVEPPKQIMVKLLTEDPNIVIYWLVDQNGGTL